jgi:hypothetical protein
VVSGSCGVDSTALPRFKFTLKSEYFGQNMKQALIVTALFCALAVAVNSQPNPAPAKGNQSAAPTTYPADHPKNEPRKWYKRSEWWLVIIAALTGLAIAVQVREMTRATKAMQVSVDAMKKKERAKLTVAVDSRGVDFSDVSSNLGEITFEVTHYGSTHAFNVRAAANALLSPSLDPPPMSDAFGVFIPNAIKSGSQTFASSVGFIRRQPQLDQIQDEQLFLHFFGKITYDDVFDEQHETTFRYFWKVDGYDFGSRDEARWEDSSHWELHGPKEDNRAT